MRDPARQHAQHGRCETHDGERAEERDLARKLGRRRRDQQRTEQAERDGIGEPGTAAPWCGLRVGDHEEEEDEHLG